MERDKQQAHKAHARIFPLQYLYLYNVPSSKEKRSVVADWLTFLDGTHCSVVCDAWFISCQESRYY